MQQARPTSGDVNAGGSGNGSGTDNDSSRFQTVSYNYSTIHCSAVYNQNLNTIYNNWDAFASLRYAETTTSQIHQATPSRQQQPNNNGSGNNNNNNNIKVKAI